MTQPSEAEFSYDHATFPYHPDCYTWPRLSVVTEDMTAAILNVHCLRDMNRKQFSLVGFIGANREDQITQVIFLAKQAGAEVIVFRGVGFTDEIIGGLMARMEEPLPDECPGEMVALVHVDWPNKIQRRILRELAKVTTHDGSSFHETRLAKRLHLPMDEVRHHLRVLADLGLVD